MIVPHFRYALVRYSGARSWTIVVNYRAWGALQQGAAKGTFLIALVNCTIQANGLSAE